MSFLKLLLSFSPWIAFLAIAHDTMLRVKIGLLVALALSIVLGLARINRGIILWAGLAFFALAFVALAIFENLWVLRHMGVLANGALAVGAWLTLLLGKPFTLDYAKAHVDRALWTDSRFIRSNQVITAVWAAAFTANGAFAYMKMHEAASPGLVWQLAGYGLLVGAAIFTNWYPAYLRRTRIAAAQAGGGPSSR